MKEVIKLTNTEGEPIYFFTGKIVTIEAGREGTGVGSEITTVECCDYQNYTVAEFPEEILEMLKNNPNKEEENGKAI